MGPTVISGLPAHILLVHVVLAIVPVAAVLVIVAAVWPAARRWLNWLPVLAALGALVFVPITTHAGHWLEKHYRGQITAAIQHHVNLGNQMFPWVLALFVASLLVLALNRFEGQHSFVVGVGSKPAVKNPTHGGSDRAAAQSPKAPSDAHVDDQSDSLNSGTGGGAHRGGVSVAARPRSTSSTSQRLGMLGSRPLRMVVAIIAIVAALGAVQQVYRTGEAGSRAVWTGTFSK
ncbi:MAG: hypothetical protein ACRDV3_17345 [Acidothermaceae bacterium]